MSMEIKESTVPDEVWVQCPFCGDEKFRLGINTKTRVGHCFHCDWRSKDAVTEVLEGTIPVVQPIDIEDPVVVLPESFSRFSQFEQSHPAFKYLKQRGVSYEQMRRLKMGYCEFGRFANRVIFPFYWEGKLEFFVARDYSGKSKVRYLNSVGRKGLYNLTEHAKGDRLILAEGIIKALRLERHLSIPAAAMLGHTLKRKLAQRIVESGYKQVCIWPDPDPSGVGIMAVKDVATVCHELNLQVVTLLPVPSQPADEATPEQLKASLDALVPMRFGVGAKLTMQVGTTRVERIADK